MFSIFIPTEIARIQVDIRFGFRGQRRPISCFVRKLKGFVRKQKEIHPIICIFGVETVVRAVVPPRSIFCFNLLYADRGETTATVAR